MDFTSKDDFLDFEESLYQDLSPHGPTRARRRQSDAKWRASVATCYDTLKHVVPKGHRASKRKVSKAVILQESERHIMHLETVLSRLISSESQASGKAVLWKEDNQLEKCTLKHFQDDFAERQHKIFHSSNQGRRCYNLLDEIKEEIFSMSVDPASLSIIDKDNISVTRCVKVNGKEVSRFSQFPIGQLVKGKDKIQAVTLKASGQSADADKHKPQQRYLEKSSIVDNYFSNEMSTHCYQKDQTVPSMCSTLTTTSRRNTTDNPVQLYSSTISTLPSNSLDDVVCSGGYTVRVSGHNGSTSFIGLNDDKNDCDDRDQEVPSFDNSGTALHETLGNSPIHFYDKLSQVIECGVANSIADGQGKKTFNFITTTPTSAQLNVKKEELDNNEIKTPANPMSLESFKSKCMDSPSVWRLRSLPENGKDPTNKSKTARKLNFTRPECVRVHQNLSEQQGHPRNPSMSPMLAGLTPIKLSPNVSYCITCKRPDESLVSPWKPLNSPLYGETSKKAQDKSPMIDPDNSLFCFETMDDSIIDCKDEIDDEKTPALHSMPEEDDPSKQAFKRKITCKRFDLLGKYQPKCRKKLDGFFDVGMAFASNPIANNLRTATEEEVHVVPDCKPTNLLQGEHEDGENCSFVGVAKDKDNADAIDFDGFFFYFRQIGQQLKDQQKLSCQEILSPCVAAKVMKMWMRLPSPDKQTIKTLALLDSQEACSSQEGVGGLSQDLQDVDVEPIDLKEFIPTTPV